jgi:hypothetical protein
MLEAKDQRKVEFGMITMTGENKLRYIHRNRQASFVIHCTADVYNFITQRILYLATLQLLVFKLEAKGLLGKYHVSKCAERGL